MSRELVLPREPIRKSRWADVSKFIGGCVLLFVLGNALARRYLNAHTPNFGYAVIRTKWKMALALKRPPDTLVLGDSSGLHGFDPQIATRLLGGRVENLCTIGDALVVNSAAMLDHIVRNVGAPKRLFLVHVYDVWHRTASGYVVAQAPLSLSTARQDFSMLQWNAELTNQWVTDRYLPLVAENESILDLLKVLARRGADLVIRGGGDRSMRTALAAAKSGIPEAHRLSPSGYLPIEHADVQQVREDLREHLSFVRSNTPEISPENLAALRGILNVAERNDIDLTLVFAPVAEDLARDDRFQAYYLGIRKLLEREVRGKAHIRIVPDQPLTYPATQMQNADHLVQSAARSWTSSIIHDTLLAASSGEDMGLQVTSNRR